VNSLISPIEQVVLRIILPSLERDLGLSTKPNECQHTRNTADRSKHIYQVFEEQRSTKCINLTSLLFVDVMSYELLIFVCQYLFNCNATPVSSQAFCSNTGLFHSELSTLNLSQLTEYSQTSPNPH
jgi:hypothetical protein